VWGPVVPCGQVRVGGAGSPVEGVLATVEARLIAASRELDRLRAEVVDLRASRRRLAEYDAAERHRLERELHQGVQQHLVALSANLQLAAGLIGEDPPAAGMLLEEMAQALDRAITEARDLAEHIFPPLLESGGLAVAIRSAAAHANVPTQVDVATPGPFSPAIARAVYLCCLEVFERADAGTEAAVTVRDEAGGLAFEVIAHPATSVVDVVRIRDRVESLGGRVTFETPADGATRVAGTIPPPE
jgi:signal transduction histidine kinase